MAEAIAAAAKALLKKLAVDLVLDKDKRNKFLLIVCSIVCGVLGLLYLPVVAIVSIGNMEIEPPQIDKSQFNESAFMESLDSESQAKLVNLQNQGQAIEDAMTAAEVRNQTIKAQLIYLSFFDGVQNFNAQSYADLFKNTTDDKALIDALNSTYGLKIDYNEFMKSYTWVMNSTMNQYMFSDSKSKNAADLTAWAENAYVSGWGYKDGTFGERDESDQIRYADSAGLILGYLRYELHESHAPSATFFFVTHPKFFNAKTTSPLPIYKPKLLPSDRIFPGSSGILSRPPLEVKCRLLGSSAKVFCSGSFTAPVPDYFSYFRQIHRILWRCYTPIR